MGLAEVPSAQISRRPSWLNPRPDCDCSTLLVVRVVTVFDTKSATSNRIGE